MKQFVQLFNAIDQTTKTTKKVDALASYFAQVNDMDKIWTIAILSHRRPKRNVRTAQLRVWSAEVANIPDWLFEESYHIVGDLAETLAQIHPNLESKHNKTLSEWIQFIMDLGQLDEDEKKSKVLWAWNQLDEIERFVFNKLITGGWRIGLSQKLMTKALSKFTGIEESALSHRLMGNWTPDSISYTELILEENEADQLSKPYPFYLAYALEKEPSELGNPSDWFAEWKWDGIRGQVIIRDKQLFVWSRGEELVTDKFPEFNAFLKNIPDGTVIDGEIICMENEEPLPFSLLQKRIGRKSVSKAILKEAPVGLIAYDLLEYEGKDIRQEPTKLRREILEKTIQNSHSDNLIVSPTVVFNSWDELTEIRKESRNKKAEGLMLKQKSAPYLVGRKKGDWWKWKVDPLTIDAVLLYAMRGHGRRANLYTDYTFAVWNGDDLVTFTKAYSGLTDKEFREVDAFVKKNTKDRFGPVRSVKPDLVFEIAFEGIAKSSRHKSGVALRFPRMHRWRKDKPKEEANTLDDLNKLLELYG